jgi:uncharacterized protein
MATGYRDQTLGLEVLSFLDRVAAETDARHVLMNRYVPKETGSAFRVGRGEILRITCCDGPQVCDFNAFAADDPSEHFWSGRTRTLQGAHLTTGDRLWSTEPKMRPMFTIIADTVERGALPHNAASHDLIYARCSARAWELTYGEPNRPNCNTNLMRALEAIGFPSTHVHDAFNIFMTTGINEKHRLFFVDPQAKKHDFIELLAEFDTVVAISCCPGGCNGTHNKGLLCTTYSHPFGVL